MIKFTGVGTIELPSEQFGNSDRWEPTFVITKSDTDQPVRFSDPDWNILRRLSWVVRCSNCSSQYATELEVTGFLFANRGKQVAIDIEDFSYLLTDESGETLTDESGDALYSDIQFQAFVICNSLTHTKNGFILDLEVTKDDKSDGLF